VTDPILFYSNLEEYFWLDNFYRASQWLPIQPGEEEVLFITNENWYQSAKAIDIEDALRIAFQPTPYLAMRAGRALDSDQIRKDWEVIKPVVMFQGLNAKFRQNEDLMEKLIDTDNRPLHENSPSDLYWGVKGQDMLGKLITQVRAQLQTDLKWFERNP